MKRRKRVLTTEYAPTTCPHCGYVVECATSMQDMNAPRPGCVTVCIKCAGVSQFTPTMSLIPFDARKLDPEAAELVRRARRLISSRRPS